MTFYKWMVPFTYVLWVFVSCMALYYETLSWVVVLIQVSTALIIGTIVVINNAE